MITLFRSLFAPPRHLILPLGALWLGLALSEKRAERHGISKEALNNLVFYSFLGYVIGGRVLFSLENLSAFRGNPLSIFSINLELFDSFGACVTAILVGFVYGQRQKLSLWSTLDALTALFATLAIGLSLSHLAAGTAFGKPTNVPWGMELWNAKRHPTQIYELIASIMIFGFIWFRKINYPAGSEFLFFIALSAGASLFLEAFRGDSRLILGGLRVAQIIFWITLSATIIVSEFIGRETKVD